MNTLYHAQTFEPMTEQEKAQWKRDRGLELIDGCYKTIRVCEVEGGIVAEGWDHLIEGDLPEPHIHYAA